ncbi:MAG TPA: hypothetical protein DEV93_15245 [Chloroflexi bacterium]|nr:hypothetical protein [Chloroflexota bacterium]
MTDEDIRSTYADLLDDADRPPLYTLIQKLETVYPRVDPPPGLAQRILSTAGKQALVPPSGTKHGHFRPRFLGSSRSVRHSVAVAVLVAIAVSLVGGVGYGMHLLTQPSGAHVVQSCTGFGAHWRLAGSGAHMTSPQRFVASGGKLIPGWRRQVSGLQRPRYWVTPADADIVDTCNGAISRDQEIGTNKRKGTQLHAMSVVPMWQSNLPVDVPHLQFPPRMGCVARPTTSPVRAPDRHPVAQLRRMPAGFSASLRVTFPPCDVAARTPTGLPPPSEEIGFAIVSQVEYRGKGGMIVVVEAQPSPAAVRRKLDLGTPAGRLPDGTQLWSTMGELRWLRGGLILSVSGSSSVRRPRNLFVFEKRWARQLKALAADVVLK